MEDLYGRYEQEKGVSATYINSMSERVPSIQYVEWLEKQLAESVPFAVLQYACNDTAKAGSSIENPILCGEDTEETDDMPHCTKENCPLLKGEA